MFDRFGLKYEIYKNEGYNFPPDEIDILLKSKHDYLNGLTTARSWATIEQNLN